jgi:hypothetical protein
MNTVKPYDMWNSYAVVSLTAEDEMSTRRTLSARKNLRRSGGAWRFGKGRRSASHGQWHWQCYHTRVSIREHFFSPSFSFIHFTLSCDKSDRADFLNHMGSGSGSGNDIILVCRLGSIFFSPSFSFIQFTLSCDKSDRISGSLSAVTSMQLDILEQMCLAYPYLI